MRKSTNYQADNGRFSVAVEEGDDQDATATLRVADRHGNVIELPLTIEELAEIADVTAMAMGDVDEGFEEPKQPPAKPARKRSKASQVTNGAHA